MVDIALPYIIHEHTLGFTLISCTLVFAGYKVYTDIGRIFSKPDYSKAEQKTGT
jgi:hypothetical protein